MLVFTRARLYRLDSQLDVGPGIQAREQVSSACADKMRRDG
jgi:hypothetical protein